MNVYEAIYTLPDEHCRLIGQFITRWAYLEWRLRETMYKAISIDPKIGRIVIREPRVVDYLTMLDDTLTLLEIKAPVNWSKFKKAMQNIESWRNKFAHSIWFKDPESPNPVLQDLTGNTLNPETKKHIKSRVMPKGHRVSAPELKKAVASVDHAVSIIDEITDAVSVQRDTSPPK